MAGGLPRIANDNSGEFEMKSAQKRVLICCVATVALYGQAIAQPLVTGNLTLYYDFDEIVNNADGEKQFLDESGNNFHGTIHEGDEFDLDPGTLTVATDNTNRRNGQRFAWSRRGEISTIFRRWC